NEQGAYRRLRILQGTSIPRFYGTIHLESPSQTYDIVHPVLSSVFGIAMEYIDGHTLEDVQQDSELSQARREEMAQSVLTVVRAARKLGVVHADIRSPNIMFRRPDLSAVLIDFVHIALRGSSMSDIEWAREVRSWSAMRATRFLLEDARMHDPTPVAQLARNVQADKLTGWKTYNEQREKMDPSRRDKYYVRIHTPGPDWIPVDDEDGTIHQWHIR
ncbi:hypothetical protein OE88DRAFT_1627386, partial [Heliocybe sulcata]